MESLTLNTLRGKQMYSSKDYDFEHRTHSADTASSMHIWRQPAENWEARTQCRDEITGSYELPFSQDWFTRLRACTARQVPIHTSFIPLIVAHELRTLRNYRDLEPSDTSHYVSKHLSLGRQRRGQIQVLTQTEHSFTITIYRR